MIINNNDKKNTTIIVECPLGKLYPLNTSGNGLTLWTVYLMINKINPPKPALKNINIAFFASFIQNKNADNNTIIKSNILSLKIVDIILAV